MNDQTYLKRACQLAEESTEPLKCGVVLVDADGRVIAEAYNSQRADKLTAAHAEMKAIAIANAKIGRKLTGLTAYGSCEPCPMCLTALIFAAVDRIVFVERLNNLVDNTKRINIKSEDFVTCFPTAPTIEQVSLTDILGQ